MDNSGPVAGVQACATDAANLHYAVLASLGKADVHTEGWFGMIDGSYLLGKRNRFRG